MKQTIFALLVALFCLSSCKTEEKVLYFQDVVNQGEITTQVATTLKLLPGDKISVIVTSSATPEVAQRYNLATALGTSASSTQSTQENIRYTLDEKGCIDMLGVGRIELQGLTRSEAAEKIQKAFRNGILNDAIVTVAAYNRYITVMGEVARPGRIEITRDNINLLEALGQCGDLTIQARRDRILVIRNEGNVSKSYYVDIRSKDLMNSPVFNLQQNDVVYVEPNRMRIGQSTYNDNSVRSINTWLSISSFLLSLGILIFK